MNVTGTNMPTATRAAEPNRPANAGGKALPPSGKSQPAAAPSPPPVSIDKALEQIRAFLSESKRELTFQRDESSGRTVIRVINPSSGEVLRQFPSEEVLKIAAIIEAQGARTFDELA